MTLLDAPRFDEARDRRNRLILFGGAGIIAVLVVSFWLLSGMPLDWPWNWYSHLRGRAVINQFLGDVEKNDMKRAYGLWIHDAEWQQHPDKTGSYTFVRFQQDWSPTSSENEYGEIKSHQIVAARMSGNVLLAGIRINGLKSKALFLNYDPRTKQLGFSPVELYLGP